MPSDDAMRAEFEAWASNGGYDLRMVKDLQEDSRFYVNPEVQREWECWQAATRAAVEALAVRFDRRADEQDAIAEFGRAHEFRRVAREIRAAGVTDRVLTGSENDGGSSGSDASEGDRGHTEAASGEGQIDAAAPKCEPPSPTDAERLDWLSRESPDIEWDPLGNVTVTWQGANEWLEAETAPTLREAIDAAMAARKEGGDATE